MQTFTTIPVQGKSILDNLSGELTPLVRNVVVPDSNYFMLFNPLFHSCLARLTSRAAINFFNTILPFAYPDIENSGQRIDFEVIKDHLTQANINNITKYKTHLLEAGLILKIRHNYYILNPLALYQSHQRSAMRLRLNLIRHLSDQGHLHITDPDQPNNPSNIFIKLYQSTLGLLSTLPQKQQLYFHTLVLHSDNYHYTDGHQDYQVLRPTFDINLQRDLERHHLLRQHKAFRKQMCDLHLLTTIHDGTLVLNPDFIYLGSEAQRTQHLTFQRDCPVTQSLRDQLTNFTTTPTEHAFLCLSKPTTAAIKNRPNTQLIRTRYIPTPINHHSFNRQHHTTTVVTDL